MQPVKENQEKEGIFLKEELMLIFVPFIQALNIYSASQIHCNEFKSEFT